MTTFGLTDAGFVPKTLNDIQESVSSNMKAIVGASIDISPRSVWGQIIGVFAGELAEVWEGGEELYSALDPDAAAGAALVSLAGITGTIPLGAESSTVTETLVGTTATVVPEGTIVSVTGRTDSRFLTLADATIAAVSAWAGTTAYSIDDRRKNTGKVYRCTQAGTSAGSGGPTGTGSIISDGTVVWAYLGTGDGAIEVPCASEKLDAITAPAGTLTRIDSPVVGLNTAVNLLDADLGRPSETDPELRARREIELRADGNAALDSVLARVSKVNGVASVAVFENDTEATDGDGVPPHSIEVVVDLDAGPPADVEDQIRAAIFTAVAGGIRPYGHVTGTVVDGSGNSQEVDFSYLTEVPAFIRLDLEVTSQYPTNGDAQVLEQLLAFEADRLVGGYDLVAQQVAAIAFNVTGVFNVSNVQVGLSSPAAGTRVSVTTRQLVTLDSSRIVIASSVVTP